MSSEADLAVEKILGDRNSTSTMEIESDDAVGSGKTPVAFSRSSRASIPRENESIVDRCDPVGPHVAGDARGSGGADAKVISEGAQSMADHLIDDAILGLVFEAHRAAKTGLFFLYDSLTNDEEEQELRLVDNEQFPGVDVFGQPLVSTAKTSKALSQLECVCPQCQQPRLACRFAPHLEKCMGMGRNSSRLASRRLAAAAAAAAANATSSSSSRGQDSTTAGNGRESNDEGDGDGDQLVNDDDDDDDDWTGEGGGSNAFGRRRTQRKRGSGVASNGRSSRRRGGVRVTPKKAANVRSGGDLMLNQSVGKVEGAKKMRKTNSYSKFPVTSSTSSQQQPFEFDVDTEGGVNDFLSLDSYDPPSPSF